VTTTVSRLPHLHPFDAQRGGLRSSCPPFSLNPLLDAVIPASFCRPPLRGDERVLERGGTASLRARYGKDPNNPSPHPPASLLRRSAVPLHRGDRRTQDREVRPCKRCSSQHRGTLGATAFRRRDNGQLTNPGFKRDDKATLDNGDSRVWRGVVSLPTKPWVSRFCHSTRPLPRLETSAGTPCPI